MPTLRFPLELWDSDSERVAILTRVVEAADGPMLVLDALGNVVFLNAAAETFWGEPAEALVNRAVVSLLGLDATRDLADAFGRRLERGEPWEGRVRPRRVDGERRKTPRRVRMDPVRASGRQGKPGPVIGAVVAVASSRG